MRRQHTSRFTSRALIASSLFLVACPTVPKEAVELSYRIGQDLEILHKSYLETITQRFAEFRRQRVVYLEQEWIPEYLADWITTGRLIDVAQGAIVWSDEDNDFVPPTPGREQHQLLYTVMSWADAARLDIDEKRAELLSPLDEQERKIHADIDEAFERLKRGNAHITAHLNSIREVQAVQQEALDQLGLKEVVADLNSGLIDASNRAEEGLQAIREADGKVDESVERSKLFMKSINSILDGNDGG